MRIAKDRQIGLFFNTLIHNRPLRMGLTNQGNKERPALRQMSQCGRRQTAYHSRQGVPVTTVTLYPLPSGLLPSAPESHRICWPHKSCDLWALAGLPKLVYRRSGFSPCP